MSTTTVHPHFTNHLTWMSLQLTVLSSSLITNGKFQNQQVHEFMYQRRHEAGCWRVLLWLNLGGTGCKPEKRNQLWPLGGFNRRQRIMQCQWVRCCYSPHLREVTVGLIRFSGSCLSHTSAALSRGLWIMAINALCIGSLWRRCPLCLFCPPAFFMFPLIFIASEKTCPNWCFVRVVLIN